MQRHNQGDTCSSKESLKIISTILALSTTVMMMIMMHPLHVYLSSLENQVELAKIDIRWGKMKKNQFEHSTYI